MYLLHNKRALICGSTQGIGKAIAICFANLGCEVILLARQQDRLKAVVRSLSTRMNQRHAFLVADFACPDNLQQVLSDRLTEFEPVHILVNNTGGPPPGLMQEADAAELIAAFSQHLLCNQLLVQAVLPAMQQNSYGRIINIISTSVKQPIAGLGVSNTIRGAVANWSKTLAGELAPSGITVNNILPGATDTSRLQTIIAAKATKMNKTAEQIVSELKKEIPMRRFARPEEIATAAGFLASDQAGYITGINLPVDGGRTSCL